MKHQTPNYESSEIGADAAARGRKGMMLIGVCRCRLGGSQTLFSTSAFFWSHDL